jgi:AcrR family transcriptional regulator
MPPTARTGPGRPRGRKPNAELSDPRSARERLLDAASELFYAEGVQSVGIDRIIACAGVAKGSLYNTFGSKEALIHAYLEARHVGTTARISAAIEAIEDPREKLLAVFDAQGQLFRQPDFHGCAFIAASAEATPGSIITQDAGGYRSWVRTMFTTLAEAAGVPSPQALARQLQLLYDGAGIAANMDHDPAIAISARAAAAALLDAALAPATGAAPSGGIDAG